MQRLNFKIGVTALATTFVAVCAQQSPVSAQNAARAFPFDVELIKPLGFRIAPNLESVGVLPRRTYLQPTTRVRLISSTGPLYTTGSFCLASFEGSNGYIRCDDPAAFRGLMGPFQQGPAGPAQVANGAATATVGASASPTTNRCMSNARVIEGRGLKLCSSTQSCKEFCSCACVLDASKAELRTKVDGATTCAGLPTSGAGMLDEGAADLQPIVASAHVSVRNGAVATQAVREGLARVESYIAAQPWKDEYGVHVSNCYRPHTDDTVAECGFVLKSAYFVDKFTKTPPTNASQRADLAFAQRAANPMNVGLSYPGATPHSSGNACDIVLERLPTHQKAFSSCALRDTPELKAASRKLDEILTNASVGATRLAYESWHYEWGTGRGCKFPDCDRAWPPQCHP